jgi:hypothetical protein
VTKILLRMMSGSLQPVDPLTAMVESRREDRTTIRKEMTMTDLPIACTLEPGELNERRTGVLARLAADAVDARELEGGYALTFAPDAGRVAKIAEVVDLERHCCAFLRFRLTVEPAGGAIVLEMTGPDGTADFLRALFSDARPAI